MGWLVLLIFLLALLGAALVWSRRRDRKFLERRASEAMRPELREELVSEEEESLRKKKKFDEIFQSRMKG